MTDETKEEPDKVQKSAQRAKEHAALIERKKRESDARKGNGRKSSGEVQEVVGTMSSEDDERIYRIEAHFPGRAAMFECLDRLAEALETALPVLGRYPLVDGEEYKKAMDALKYCDEQNLFLASQRDRLLGADRS